MNETWLLAIAQNLVASVLYTLLGVILGVFVIDRYRERRNRKLYGGWHVMVTRRGTTLVDRAISVRKAKEILEESSELSVFIKGVVSPYERLNCDILDRQKYPELLLQDALNRRFIVDLDKNPPEDGKGDLRVL